LKQKLIQAGEILTMTVSTWLYWSRVWKTSSLCSCKGQSFRADHV